MNSANTTPKMDKVPRTPAGIIRQRNPFTGAGETVVISPQFGQATVGSAVAVPHIGHLALSPSLMPGF